MSDPRDNPAHLLTVPPPDPPHSPYDIEVEQALLGAMILDEAAVIEAQQHVEPQHFFDPVHARIFETMSAFVMDGDRVITPLTLAAEMKADPGLAEVGGVRYLAGLAGACPAMPNVRDYARIIRELALRRDALAALKDCFEAIAMRPTTVSKALRGILGVAEEAERLSAAGSFQATGEAAMEAIRAAERAAAGKPVRAVRTGIKALDDETGGLQGSDFIVIAGKSGMGKSALMGGISWRAAAAYYPVIVFSLEMKRLQWVQRILTDIDFDGPDIVGPLVYAKFRKSGISSDGQGRGFTAGEFERLMHAQRQLEEWPWLEIHDEDGLTMAQIAARTRAFAAKWKNDPEIRAGQNCPPDEDPIGLVILDYIQIVDPGSRQFRPREQEVAGIARAGKGLAKRLDWPVMAGSQLNEGEAGRAKDEKRPQGGDVRESKAIFHEADIMLAPYREAFYVRQQKPDAAPGDPAHIAWLGLMKEVRHKFELLGIKNRMGNRFELNLYADMAASAIRDEEPIRRRTQQLADDLLNGFNP